MKPRYRDDTGPEPPATHDRFAITGGFLSRGGYPMRSWLDVVRRALPQAPPDIMVIMMNPGASGPSPPAPAEGARGGSAGAQPHLLAKPDRTQLQIIRLMSAVGLNHARILNLSDFRTSHSRDLVRFLASEDAAKIDHSIFSPSRTGELESLLVRDIPIVYAWGVHTSILPLAQRAVDLVGVSAALRLPKAGTPYAYYHPLPPVYARQLAWVREVAAQLKRRAATDATSRPSRQATAAGTGQRSARQPGDR